MRRALKWAGLLLATLLLLPILLVGAVLVSINTGPGQRAIENLAAKFVPGLTIEGLHGPIPGRPGFSKLTMADSRGPWLVVENAELKFALRDLLDRQLRIERLTADRVALLHLPESGPTPPEETPTEPGPLIPALPDLPVAVQLDRLAVARIEIPRELVAATVEEQAPAPGFALSLEGNASLVAQVLRAKLGVQRLEAPGRLDLDLGLDPKGALSADLRVQEPPGGVLATALGIAEAPADLSLRLNGPASGADLTARAAFADRAGFQAKGRLALDPAGGGALALAGSLDAPANLAPEPVRHLEFDLDALLPAGADPALRRLVLTAKAGRIEASGTMAALDVKADIADSAALAPLVPDIIGWQAIGLTARVENGERFTARMQPRGLHGPQPMDKVLGPEPVLTYRGGIFQVEDLTVQGAGARLNLTGTGWEALDLRVKLEAPELQAIRPELSGPIALDAHITGPATDPAITANAESPGITAAGRRIESPRLSARIPSISGMAGEVTLNARAEGQPVLLDIAAASVGELVRLSRGEITFGPIRGRVTGEFNTATTLFNGETTIQAADLAPLSALVGQQIAGRLNLQAKLAPVDGRQGADAKLEVGQLRYAGQSYGAEMTLKGTDAALDWNIRATLPQANVTGRGRFARGDEGMRFDLAAFEARQGEMGLRLAAPGTIRLPPSGAVEIPGLRFAARPAGNFTVSGRWGPDTADLRVALAALPLSLANMFVPEPRLAGTVVGEARITGPTTAPEVNATFNGTGMTVTAPWSRGWPAATLQAKLRRQGSGAIEADAAFRMGALVALNAEARLPRGPAADAPLNARVTGNANLQPLLAPTMGGGANRVTGRIAMDGSAGGTVGAPQLAGSATLSGGDVRNPLYGLRLTDLGGRLRFAGDRVLLEDFSARAGRGRITIAGEAQPFAPGIPIDLAITARDAEPVKSEMLTALANADLRFTGPLQTDPRLAGTVRLERVVVNIPQELPGGGVATLGEVREHGAGAPPPPTAPAGPPAAPIALAITVQAPQSVLIRGRGLDAELGGTIRIGGTAASPQPEGAFSLRRGSFQLLDRRLTFSQGSLTFDGALMPALDFAASTPVQGTTITVTITGRPADPKIAFTSSPELPQDEVLARLLFGRSVDRLSPFELAQLAGGVASLAGVGPGGSGGGFFGRLRDRLGLDRLGVGSSSAAQNSTARQQQDNPALQAGGYIGQGVYVGVEQGTEGAPRVGVDIELTPRLKLQSSTGGDGGERLGLSYELEY